MQLFQLKNYNLIIAPEAMSISVFANVNKNNKGNPDMTLKELSYMWHYCDVRSDFASIIDDKERSKEIRASLSLPNDWKISKELSKAVTFYIEHSITPSSGLYHASITAAKFIENKLRKTQDMLDEKDLRGTPIYKVDTILNMIKNVPDVMAKLHKAKIQVIQELEAQGGLKGTKEKKIFEDGIGGQQH